MTPLLREQRNGRTSTAQRRGWRAGKGPACFDHFHAGRHRSGSCARHRKIRCRGLRDGAQCLRHPRLKNKPLYEPAGIRGDGPTQAVRYWGVTQREYYERADVWPLNPKGEIFVILMIEDTEGIANLKDILKNVPGIGAILIGEGDLSQELGYPRQYEHKVVLDAMAQIVSTCREANVVVGHPPVETHNVERVVKEGYRFLMCAPVRSYGNLDKARELTKRA